MLSHKRAEVLDAIDRILETYQSQKRRVSNDVLLLRYYWLDAVSDKVRTAFSVESTAVVETFHPHHSQFTGQGEFCHYR